jgi:hypothetical protein
VAPVTHQPAPGDTQGNVSRQLGLAGAVVLGVGVWSCTSAATRGQRALLRFFISSALVKRAVPGPSRAAREGLAGMAELAPLFPGGAGGGAKHVLAFRRELIGVQTTKCTR